MWIDYFGYEIAEIEDSLIIKGHDPDSGKIIFYVPCGPLDHKSFLNYVSNYCCSQGVNADVIFPVERFIDSQCDTNGVDYNARTDWMEYLYNASTMSGFSGRKMEKKRNHLNFFKNNYSPYEIEEINKDNIPEIISYTYAFEMVHEDSELALYECSQVIEVLRNYEYYPFIGIAVRKKGNIIGYSFGEIIHDTFFAHVEKGDTAYRGIYQLLASEMTKRALIENPDIQYINREEDMGDENLRLSKESYHPTLLLDKVITEIRINK